MINDQLIDFDSYQQLIQQAFEYADQMEQTEIGRPSMGEIRVVISYVYFVNQGCDLAVYEALCGGQFDATNIFDNKLATILTTVGYDHMAILGDTLEKIAIDKSHIARENIPFYCGVTDSKLQQLIQVIANQSGTTAKFINADPQTVSEKLAKTVLQQLGINEFTKPAIGLPGRFELLKSEDKPVLLDGAHNTQKMDYLIDRLSEINYQKLHVLFSVATGKNVPEMLERLNTVADSITLCQVSTNGRPMQTIDELQIAASQAGVGVSVNPDPDQAYDHLIEVAGPDDLILVTGSLHLSGLIRNRFYPADQILGNRSSFA